jgi:hypothetical protein
MEYIQDKVLGIAVCLLHRTKWPNPDHTPSSVLLMNVSRGGTLLTFNGTWLNVSQSPNMTITVRIQPDDEDMPASNSYFSTVRLLFRPCLNCDMNSSKVTGCYYYSSFNGSWEVVISIKVSWKEDFF